MATTLQDIIEKQALIIREAKELGFVDIHIHYKSDEDELVFVVTCDPDLPDVLSEYSTYLAASLRKLLSCDLTVIVKSTIKPLFLNDIQDNMAPLADPMAVKKIFHTDKPKEIIFSEINEEDEEESEILSNVEEIKKILKQKREQISQSSNQPLFTTKKRKPQDLNEEKTSKKVHIETGNVKANTTSYIVTIPDECDIEEVLEKFRRYIEQNKDNRLSIKT
jgi:hypothetical protein